MKYLIDYENVDVNGFLGTKTLTENDKIIIFYSEKSKRVDWTIINTLTATKADFELIGGHKSAPNYMDFWIVCECSKIFFKENEENIAIISKDKGYISVKDYFERMGKTIILSSDIGSVKPIENKSAIATLSVPPIIKKIEPVKIEKALKTDNTPTKKDKKNKKDNKTQNDEPKTLSQRTHYRRFSFEEKEKVRELVAPVINNNSDLMNDVFTSLDTATTVGMLRFYLVGSLGRISGEKVFKIIRDTFFQKVDEQ